MISNILNKNKKGNTPDATLKVTTLLYLGEALRKEEYEKCANLVEKAREYGAKESEIKQALADYIRLLKTPQPVRLTAAPRPQEGYKGRR